MESSNLAIDPKDELFQFTIICTCWEKIDGEVGCSQKSDTVHCKCGLVWEVNRPYKEDTK